MARSDNDSMIGIEPLGLCEQYNHNAEPYASKIKDPNITPRKSNKKKNKNNKVKEASSSIVNIEAY